jgi:hypothetical protein
VTWSFHSDEYLNRGYDDAWRLVYGYECFEETNCLHIQCKFNTACLLLAFCCWQTLRNLELTNITFKFLWTLNTVKLQLCKSRVPPVRKYKGRRDKVSNILVLETRCREAFSSTLRPLYSRGRRLRYTLDKRPGWPQSGIELRTPTFTGTNIIIAIIIIVIINYRSLGKKCSGKCVVITRINYASILRR